MEGIRVDNINGHSSNTTEHKKRSQQSSPSKTNSPAIELSCLFCQKFLFKPRILDCLHTYCEECIDNNITFDQNNADVGVVKCLICSEYTKLSVKNKACMLPYNFFANNAMDFLMIQCQEENAIICTGCSDNSVAVSRCSECSEFLCFQCISAHRRIRLTKDHKLTPLDLLRYDRTSVHRPVFCPDHDPELFTFYCEVCEDLICRECTILQHRGHKYERLSDALENKKPIITKLLEQNAQEKVPPISRAVDEVQDMAARLYARTVATKQAIRKCAETCIRDIEMRCEDLISEVENLYREKSATLDQQQKKLQIHLMKNKSTTQFVNYAFQHGSEPEIFELLDLMTTRLRNLNDRKLDYEEPDENDVIEHMYDSDDVRNISRNLGYISTSRIFLSHTKLYGPGLTSAKVEIETFFVIEMFDRNRETCCHQTISDPIKVKIQAPEGFSLNNKITNNKDGTFTVKYTPVTKGLHNISVKIRGKSFPNSQFSVRVFEGIDYTQVKDCYLCFGQKGSKYGDFKTPWAITTAQQGNFFITDRGHHKILVYDKFGSFLFSFGTKGTKDGQFSGPEGIAIDQSGFIFVADSENHRIQTFDQNGTFTGKFGRKGQKEGELFYPSGLYIDKNGQVVVCDRGNHRIQIFTSFGQSLLTFGSFGNQYGQLNNPRFVKATGDRYIIGDEGNNRIVFYDHKGLYSSEIRNDGDDKPGDFESPAGIGIDREGYIIVVDSKNHRIQVFTPTQRFFTTFGSFGYDDVQFNNPCGVTLTSDGRLAVVDKLNHRIQVF